MNRKAEQILKVDITGRVWTPREQREAALEAFAGSGLPATKFAERIGVKYTTFASWVQKRRRQQGGAGGGMRRSSAPKALRWVEAVADEAEPPSARGMLTVHLRCGARLEVGDAAQVALAAELLRALGTGGAAC